NRHPPPAIVQGSVEHPLGQRADDTGLLRQGDELIRGDQAVLGMVPADQRLDAAYLPGFQADLWLIVETEAVPPDRLLQSARQLQEVGAMMVLGRRIEGVPAVPAFGDI